VRLAGGKHERSSARTDANLSGIEVGLFVLVVRFRPKKVVAETDVHRQFRRNPPIVLGIGGSHPAVVVRVIGNSGSGAVLLVRKKVGDAGPGVGHSRDACIYASIVIGASGNDRLQFRSVDSLKIHAELQRVVADDLRQIVQKFQYMLVFQRRIIVGRSETGDPRRRHVHHPALARGERDSSKTKRLRNVRVGVELLLREISIVVADTKLVDEVGIENVCFASREVLPYVRVVAIAVVSVKSCAKRRRRKLMHIRVAEASERLVFGTDVPVYARVPLERVVGCIQVHIVIVVNRSVVRVGQRIHLQNVEGNLAYLSWAEHVVLPIAT
jgi:hypothetical protein